MKHSLIFPILVFVVFLLVPLSIFTQNIAINSTGNPPNESAMLDIASTAKGLLIPRVNLTSTASNAPIGASITSSLLVYNEASVNNVTPGYYYWNGSAWTRLINGATNYSAGTGISITADNEISNTGIITASNGLTKTGTNIKLGGNLIDATTTVNVQSNTLNITGNQSRIAIGSGASTSSNYSLALGNNAVVSGSEATAIGAANTGISTSTTAGAYSVAIGSNLLTSGGSNNNTNILIGHHLENTTAGSIMLGIGNNGATRADNIPGITILKNTATGLAGNVGIGTKTPQRSLHVVGNNNLGHIQQTSSFLRIQNVNNETCTNDNLWDFRVGNCGQLGLVTYSSNGSPNFNLLKNNAPNDGSTASSGTVVGFNTNAPLHSFMLHEDGKISVGTNVPEATFLTTIETSSTIGGLRINETNTGNGIWIDEADNGSGLVIEERNAGSGVIINQSVGEGAGSANGYGILLTSTGTNEPIYVNHNGNIATLSTAGVWTNASDSTLKKNILPIDYGLDVVQKLRPVSYQMKSNNEKQVGFIAQEVIQLVPEVVSENEGATMSMSYGNLVAVLTKAIQEQQIIIENQQKEIYLLQENQLKSTDDIENMLSKFNQLEAELKSIKNLIQETEKAEVID
jgi:trimeric autotransporter adhesin